MLKRITHNNIQWTLFIWCCLNCSVLCATELKLRSTLSSSFIQILEGETSGVDTSGSQVWSINPTLMLDIEGPVWNGNWEVAFNEIRRLEPGSFRTNYTNIRLNNSLSWWDERLTFIANGMRQNQNINRNQAGIADQLFSDQEFINVDTVTTGVNFRTSRKSSMQVNLNVQAADIDFDEAELGDTTSQTTSIVKGQNQSASLVLARNANSEQINVSLQSTYQKILRDNRGDQESSLTRVDLSIPIWGQLNVTANGFKSERNIENTSLLSSDIEFESYGTGLLWRIGNRSFISVTRNRTSQSGVDDFTELRVNLEPTDRTVVFYENSRRFYGESNTFRLAHSARRLKLSMSYIEQLDVRTRLLRNEETLPILCDPLDQTNCSLVTFVRFSLDEDLVLNRTGILSIGYQMKKSEFSFSYSHRNTEFLEIGSELETETFNFTYVHKMNRRNRLNVRLNQSSRQSIGENQDRTSYRLETQFLRRLTRNAEGTIGIQKLYNNLNTGVNRRDDTRLLVKYTYRF